jgi:hypothetical protein
MQSELFVQVPGGTFNSMEGYLLVSEILLLAAVLVCIEFQLTSSSTN